MTTSPNNHMSSPSSSLSSINNTFNSLDDDNIIYDLKQNSIRSKSDSISNHYSILRSSNNSQDFANSTIITPPIQSIIPNINGSSPPNKKSLLIGNVISKIQSPISNSSNSNNNNNNNNSNNNGNNNNNNNSNNNSNNVDFMKILLKKTTSFVNSSIDNESTYGPITKTMDDNHKTSNKLDLKQGIPKIDNLLIDDNESSLFENFSIPDVLIKGLPLIRITKKKRISRIFKIDLEKALLIWNNKSTSKLSIDKIQQVRITNDGKNYREEYGISNEFNDRWITIVYHDLIISSKLKTLHIIAPSRQDFIVFTQTLINLIKRRKKLMQLLNIPNSNDNLIVHWNDYISTGIVQKNIYKERESLSFNDVLNLMKKLHINCDESYLNQIFKQFSNNNNNDNNENNNDVINFTNFSNFVKFLKKRLDIEEIFNELLIDINNEGINLNEFIHFNNKIQHSNLSSDEISKIFNKISNSNSKLIDLNSFTNYLKSSPHLKELTQDLTKPLNEYYISSSHNTYLIGKQYGGSASIEGYIKALQRGCRCLEIDIWDGDSGPVVTHGKLTSSAPVKDVFETIKKYSWVVTSFPLFLSFEIHCKIDYQYKIYQLILEIFDDLLQITPLKINEGKLPSPLDLQNKILIKIKKIGEFNSSYLNEDSSLTTSNSNSNSTTNTTSDELDLKKILKLPKRKKSVKIIPELSNLAIYSQGIKFRNFSLPESKTMNHIFSFSENTFNSMVKDREKEYLLLKHNRKFFMRVYPSGFRYNSKNFKPIKFWNYGVQMVATNWQTYDLGQQINEALFKPTGKIGYFLKNQNLRNLNSNVKFKYLNQSIDFLKFKIDIISAQYLPKPNELKILNPMVQFELIDTKLINGMTITNLFTLEKSISKDGIGQTNIINGNGFNPIWKYRFEGLIQNSNDLNFLRFLIKSDNSPFATNCFNLTSLRKGYRHIPLYDMNGEEYIFSTLFIHVEYEEINNN
ncbi:hypothetical protein WICMUC_003523 [Wickerhamomyces mucosus]|uniref:Phosphoinositide phospholipase C n=1 Tax=Wickerhamomyces mucosus TaxID=1378264 RepID=A0A9P8PLP4_9ASCO|nr:hypothetical protein WICMUC_003523 [Wickerhamomyces mucosus]